MDTLLWCSKKENMTSSRDLTRYQRGEGAAEVADAFAKIVSGGKPGYKTVIEKKVFPPKCVNCGRGGDNGQKFCPQCGGKMVVPLTNCPGCDKPIDDAEKFCTECGHKLK
ncbi:zinc ribbon domain-containing protein [Candidatus Pacearchaeota archaeon]|nr:zinc ribbon domain-containing protein [Candidatus Pacearchaeota archaeon]